MLAPPSSTKNVRFGALDRYLTAKSSLSSSLRVSFGAMLMPWPASSPLRTVGCQRLTSKGEKASPRTPDAEPLAILVASVLPSPSASKTSCSNPSVLKQ